MSKQIDRIGEYMRVLTDEHNTILKHHQSENINKYINTEQGQNSKTPILNEVGLS